MAKRPDWSRPLPQPLTIPDIMTIETLADVRVLIGHVPAERRKISTWQHVEKTLQACADGDDVENVSVAMQLAFQLERVPYSVGKENKGRAK